MTFQAKAQLSGPFFTKDPMKTIIGNIGDFNEKLADYGEKRVRGAIESRSGQMRRWTGHSRDHVIGRTRAETTRGGRRWAVTAVVSESTDGMSRADAIRTKAAGAGIERRWHPFRSASFAMRAKVKELNLSKGLE